MQRASIDRPAHRASRDEFTDKDTIQSTDIHHGSYSPRDSINHVQKGRFSSLEKGKGKERGQPGLLPEGLGQPAHQSSSRLVNDHSGIQRLPLEATAQIFAKLPPASLLACSLVCHDWYDIIRQDSTWRAAFFYHFCLEESLARVPGSRLSAESWQSEFIARYALAQKWTKSKVSTITHDPRVGNISLIHANLALERHATSRSSAWKPKSAKDNNAHGNAPTMISVSIPRGTASRSDPFSGKVAKGGFIEGAPTPVFIAGLGGNLDTVTTAAISRDGNTIAWGMANGSLHLSRTGLGGRYIHGQGQRASPPAPVGTPLHNHFGPVTAVSFIDGSDIMASAATDGIVKLWDPTAGAVWASPDVTSAGVGRPDDIEILTARFSKISSTLVLLAAGRRAGLVHFWTVDLKARIALDYRKVDPLNTGGEPSLPVEVIRIDPTRSALLVQYQLESCFYRIEWPSIDDIKVTKFAHQDGFLGSITAIHANFAEQEKKLEITGGIVSINGQDTPATPVEDSATSTSLVHRSFGGFSYIVAGDDQGRTFIWDWEEQHTAAQSVYPLRQLQGFETKVTSIEVTDLLILIGTADGMVRAYDLLSSRLVRVFNERSAPRQALRHILTGQADADEEAKWSVSHIVASREGFVASIGARILAWRAGDESKLRKKAPKSGGRLSSRAERYRVEMELKQDIRESTAVLDHEHNDRMSRLQEYRGAQTFAGIPKSLGDMTDEEALALAMMMSREEEEGRQNNMMLDDSLDAFGEDDLEHLRLEEEEEDEEGNSDPGSISEVARTIPQNISYGLGSSRASPSRHNDAEWRSKSYEYTGSLPTSPYSRHSLSPPTTGIVGSYPKIQLSPRLNPYLHASPRSSSPVPDLDEISDWPLPSPVDSATSPAIMNRARASPQASSTAPLDSGGKAWSSAPPWKTAPIAGPTSGLTAGLKEQQTWPAPAPVSSTPAVTVNEPGPNEEEMDEELRYVLELSRAEEESRQAAARSNF